MIIILDLGSDDVLYYIIIYMIIINFLRSLFFGLYWSYVDFFRALLYIIYIILGLGILFDDSMYIVFKDIFIFRCVFGLTKRVCDFGQGFKYNIIRP